MTLAFFDSLSSCSSSLSSMIFLFLNLKIYIYINFYSAVLVSSIQQHKPTISIHPSCPHLPTPYPSRASRGTRLGSVCYRAIHPTLDSVCVVTLPSPFVPLSPPLCPQVHSLHRHLHTFLAKRFINIIFLGAIQMFIYCLLFLFLTYFTLYNRF